METAPLHNDVAEGPEGGAAWWLRTKDGVRIRVGYWPCEGARGTVFMFPGRTEYVEKYGRTAAELAEHGYAMLSVDWRGQGLADRPLDDRNTGHVGTFSEYQNDVEAMVSAAKELDLPHPWHLIGHSMGGCIGLRALVNGMDVKGAAFSAPMWGLELPAVFRPVAQQLSGVVRSIGLGHIYAPGTKPETYVKTAPFEGNTLTSDAEMYNYMHRQVTEHPELALGGPSINWVHEALKETSALTSMPPPAYPTYTALGSDEVIVSPQRIKSHMEKWPSGTLEMFEGGRHEIIMEDDQMRKKFLDGCVQVFETAA